MATFLFCTGAAAVAARWPMTVEALRVRTQVDDHRPGACLDLTIEISPAGEICRADFEFVDLDQLLVDLGRAEIAGRCSTDELQCLDSKELALQLRAAVEILMPLK
ncbi:hypothetical protein [Actinospongicola halichondriae]|uniref:hypothetical protein n=1 Tax=Actinospongicola halichondriae TaxID=3236844 RepID=UPI003D3DBACC